MINKKQFVCIVAVMIVIIISVTAIIITNGVRQKNSVVYIYSEGTLIKTIEKLNMDDDYTFDIVNKKGNHNEIIVKGGKVGVISADCPDKICQNTPHISDNLFPIICVPNGLVIRVEEARPQ